MIRAFPSVSRPEFLQHRRARPAVLSEIRCRPDAHRHEEIDKAGKRLEFAPQSDRKPRWWLPAQKVERSPIAEPPTRCCGCDSARRGNRSGRGDLLLRSAAVPAARATQ